MQQLITTGDEVSNRNFLGAHPTVTVSGILAKGRHYQAGEVLGQVTADKKLKALAPGANDGTENAKSILLGEDRKSVV